MGGWIIIEKGKTDQTYEIENWILGELKLIDWRINETLKAYRKTYVFNRDTIREVM